LNCFWGLASASLRFFALRHLLMKPLLSLQSHKSRFVKNSDEDRHLRLWPYGTGFRYLFHEKFAKRAASSISEKPIVSNLVSYGENEPFSRDYIF